MKLLIAFLAGAVVATALSRRIGHAAFVYSEHGLPTPWHAPKGFRKRDGVITGLEVVPWVMP